MSRLRHSLVHRSSPSPIRYRRARLADSAWRRMLAAALVGLALWALTAWAMADGSMGLPKRESSLGEAVAQRQEGRAISVTGIVQ